MFRLQTQGDLALRGGLSGVAAAGASFNDFILSTSPSSWLSTRFSGDVLTSGVQSVGENAVDTWNGRVSAKVFTQGTAASKPIFKTGIQNGQPVIRFDGSNDQLLGNAASLDAAQNTSAMTLIQVAGWTSFKPAADSNCIGMTTATGGARIVLASGSNNAGSASRKMVARALDTDGASLLSSPATYPAGIEILVAIFDFANKRGRMLRNGTEIMAYTTFGSMTAGATSNTASTAFTLGAFNGANPSIMDFSELLVYKRVPTDSELLQIARGFGSIYGIPTA